MTIDQTHKTPTPAEQAIDLCRQLTRFDEWMTLTDLDRLRAQAAQLVAEHDLLASQLGLQPDKPKEVSNGRA